MVEINTPMTSKPKRIPVKVPWAVESAISGLVLTISESESEMPTMVELNAVGPPPEGDSLHQFPLPVREDSPVRILPLKRGLEPGCHGARIRITFTRGITARFVPGYADTAVVNPELYDDSMIPLPYVAGQNMSDWIDEFGSEWIRSGLCPNPYMYEVHGSDWLREIAGEGSHLKHYLIEGHDAYVEVIAEGWAWEEIGGAESRGG